MAEEQQHPYRIPLEEMGFPDPVQRHLKRQDSRTKQTVTAIVAVLIGELYIARQSTQEQQRLAMIKKLLADIAREEKADKAKGTKGHAAEEAEEEEVVVQSEEVKPLELEVAKLDHLYAERDGLVDGIKDTAKKLVLDIQKFEIGEILEEIEEKLKDAIDEGIIPQLVDTIKEDLESISLHEIAMIAENHIDKFQHLLTDFSEHNAGTDPRHIAALCLLRCNGREHLQNATLSKEQYSLLKPGMGKCLKVVETASNAIKKIESSLNGDTLAKLESKADRIEEKTGKPLASRAQLNNKISELADFESKILEQLNKITEMQESHSSAEPQKISPYLRHTLNPPPRENDKDESTEKSPKATPKSPRSNR